MAKESDLPLCRGCRDDFYNQPGNSAEGRCWMFDKAEVVERFRLGWWTRPTEPMAYCKVVTLSCHHAPGRYAQHKELPDCFPERDRVQTDPAIDARSRRS